LFGALAGLIGAIISSLGRGLSTGPIIVLTASTIAIFSLLFAPNRGIIWEQLRRRHNNRRLGKARVLETLYTLADNHGDPTHPHSAASLQAVLPFDRVRSILPVLQAEGLVTQSADSMWALTAQGMTQVQQFFKPTSTAAIIKEKRQEVLA
jgi:manganese/zinc/iron transport system permease protein